MFNYDDTDSEILISVRIIRVYPRMRAKKKGGGGFHARRLARRTDGRGVFLYRLDCFA